MLDKDLTYGPKITNGGLPAGRAKIDLIAVICGGFSRTSAFIVLTSPIAFLRFSCSEAGNRILGSTNAVASAWCMRRSGILLRQKRMSNRVLLGGKKRWAKRSPTSAWRTTWT